MSSRIDPNAPGNPRSNAGEKPVVESANDARQGPPGFPVLKVLIAALVLAAIAWGVAGMYGESTDAPSSQTATPPAGDTQPAAPAQQPSSNP